MSMGLAKDDEVCCFLSSAQLPTNTRSAKRERKNSTIARIIFFLPKNTFCKGGLGLYNKVWSLTIEIKCIQEIEYV